MRLSPKAARAGIEGIASGLLVDLQAAERAPSPEVRASLLRRAEARSARAFAWTRILAEASAAPAGQRMRTYPEPRAAAGAEP